MNFVQLYARELKFLVFFNLVHLNQHTCHALYTWQCWLQSQDFDRSAFYGTDIICSFTPALSSSFAIPRLENVSTENIVRFTEIERKIFPSSRRPLRLKFIKLNGPVNAFDPPRSAWAPVWLLSPWERLWSGNIQTVNTGHHSLSSINISHANDWPNVHRSCSHFVNNTLHCSTSFPV